MLSYNEITPKKYIVYEGAPWEVTSSNVFRKQKRKPVNQTKLKNLITGRVVEISFHQSDKVEEAEIESKKIKYLYTNPQKGEFWFSEEDDPSKRFDLPESTIGEGSKFLKENSLVDALIFEDPSSSSGQANVIGIKLPIKVDLKVAEAPPNIKGGTAGGGNKSVTLETGATVTTPLFINEGDVIRVNTETGEYVERV